jgi:hypothetical protein
MVRLSPSLCLIGRLFLISFLSVLCKGSPLSVLCKGSPLSVLCKGSPLSVLCKGSPLSVLCKGSPLSVLCLNPLLIQFLGYKLDFNSYVCCSGRISCCLHKSEWLFPRPVLFMEALSVLCWRLSHLPLCAMQSASLSVFLRCGRTLLCLCCVARLSLVSVMCGNCLLFVYVLFQRICLLSVLCWKYFIILFTYVWMLFHLSVLCIGWLSYMWMNVICEGSVFYLCGVEIFCSSFYLFFPSMLCVRSFCLLSLQQGGCDCCCNVSR